MLTNGAYCKVLTIPRIIFIWNACWEITNPIFPDPELQHHESCGQRRSRTGACPTLACTQMRFSYLFSYSPPVVTSEAARARTASVSFAGLWKTRVQTEWTHGRVSEPENRSRWALLAGSVSMNTLTDTDMINTCIITGWARAACWWMMHVKWAGSRAWFTHIRADEDMMMKIWWWRYWWTFIHSLWRLYMFPYIIIAMIKQHEP